jgi:hypothetical protein
MYSTYPVRGFCQTELLFMLHFDVVFVNVVLGADDS